jgi:nucleoside-diphosphate-sugar epimerase
VAVVILGCGYTGRRVATRLAGRGVRVIATTRLPERLRGVPAEIVQLDVSGQIDLSFVPPGAAVLYSIPVTQPDLTPAIISALHGRSSRVVYLSTTSVYGPAFDVDEHTPADPRDEGARARVAVEDAILKGPWSGLVLRPAAIYGPGRGVHVRLQRGDYSLVGDGGNYVSRIHVDDLAVHAEAALFSSVTGAFPVADDEPCTAREIVRFCTDLLSLPLPSAVTPQDVHPTRRANRRVRGSAIRELLGITLQYPTYRIGIPASLESPGSGNS